MTAISIFDVTDEHLPPPRNPGSNGGYGQGRPKFTRTDLRDILAARAAGDTLATIARRYDCDQSAIRYQLRRHLADQPEAAALPNPVCVRCGIDNPGPLCQDCTEVCADLGDTWAVAS